MRLVLALVLALAPASVAAQDSPSAEAVPSAEEVIGRYVEAIGGADAIRSHTSMHMMGEFAMPGMGISGTLEVFQTDPHLSLTRIELQGVGTITAGFNGEVAWEMNPFQGPRIKEGAELAQVRDESGTGAMLRDAALFESRETVGRSEWSGEACWRVKLVWKSGREAFDCYSIDTGLLIGSEMTAATGMGDVPATMTMTDYKDFGGVLLASKVRQEAMGMEQVFTFTTVSYEPIDPSVFALPAEIQALVKP